MSIDFISRLIGMVVFALIDACAVHSILRYRSHDADFPGSRPGFWNSHVAYDTRQGCRPGIVDSALGLGTFALGGRDRCGYRMTSPPAVVTRTDVSMAHLWHWLRR